MSLTEYSGSFQFKNGSWKEVEESELVTHQSLKPDLKVGMFNVLWGFSNSILNTFGRSKKRFDYILNTLIPNSDPDILSLMEVSEVFIEMLLQTPYIRNNYYISHIEKKRKDYVHEVLIISKIPFSTIFMNDNDYGRCLFSVFANKQDSSSFIVSTTHLWAYENDHNRRKLQMELIDLAIQTTSFLDHKQIPVQIKKAGKEAVRQNNLILQGDLNLHLRYEDSFIYEYGFVDVWREVYPQKDGYTWDAQKNKFIASMYIFDNRRMRLDRILLRKKSQLFSIKDIEIKAQEQIGYRLSCSDHYMLLSHLQINSEPKEYQQKYDTSQIIMEKNTGFRQFPTIIKLRIICLVGLLLGVVGAFVVVPFLRNK